MAFNPFNSFRKYSKSMFAVLAIICMFTFVLSSGMGGRGDFMEVLPTWIGGGSRSPTVATIFGTPITQQTVEEVRQQRLIANMTMIGFVSRANLSLARELKAELPKLSKEVADLITRPLTQKMQLAEPLGSDNPMVLMQIQQTYMRMAPFLANQLQQRLQTINQTENAIDYSAIRRMLHILETDAFLMASARFSPTGNGFFFLNAPMQTERDLLEFILWSKKAEQMGINFTPEQVHTIVERETLGGLRSVDAGMVERGVRQNFRGTDTDMITKALAREFEVRLAQTIVMGESFTGRTRTRPPAFTSPQEFYTWYKDNTSETRYFTLTVPVSKYVEQVTAKPTDEELQKLYLANRMEEPDPSLERPGFKAPRKVQVQFVTGDPESSYYKSIAPKVLATLTAATQISNALTMPFGGGAVAPATAIAIPLTFADAPLYAEYDRYLTKQLRWTDWFNRELRDTSVLRRPHLAALVGQTIGSLNTGAGILSGPLLFDAMAVQHEITTRVKVGLPLVLASFSPNFLTGVMNSAAAIPTPLSLETLKPTFRLVQLDEMARKQFLADLKAVAAEVEKLGGTKTGPADVAKYLAEFATPRGLTVGTSGSPRDRFAIADDPALAPLKAIYTAGHSSQMSQGQPQFGETFFEEPFSASRNTYLPRWYPDRQEPLVVRGDQNVYLTWRTQDIEPLVREFAAVRPEVEAAWRFEQARKLAKEDADKLAKQIQDLGGNRAQLLDLATQKGLNWFELGPVAKLLQQPGLQMGGGGYEQFTMPKSYVQYPGPKMVDDLLSIRNDKLGATKVLTDDPGNFFYVASLVQRDEKTEADFMNVYSKTSVPANVNRNPLYNRYLEPEQQAELRKEAMEQLKAEANYTEAEILKKETDKSANLPN